MLYIVAKLISAFGRKMIRTVRIRCRIEAGFIPAEKTVFIKCADGVWEEVTVSTKSLFKNRLEASEIGRTAGRVLVELPRESTSGHWRLWVKQSSVGA